MSSFDDREKGFEAKYRMDQETRFKVIARRNRLLGEWAAGRMGITGDDAAAYAKEVVVADFDRPGDDDVIEKVVRDLGAKGIAADAAEIRAKLEELAQTARDQIAGAQK
ncbi:MAG TPA: DUF1476 domain-containing protein [Alphaproteobacteria bacterium]|jgi:hypothetical protein